MRKLSDVQTTLTRLRKKYRQSIEKGDIDSVKRLEDSIHTLEWILEIQTTPTTDSRD
nr:MAG TPA: hypothetical protein [Caudoviricetes sp.]